MFLKTIDELHKQFSEFEAVYVGEPMDQHVQEKLVALHRLVKDSMRSHGSIVYCLGLTYMNARDKVNAYHVLHMSRGQAGTCHWDLGGVHATVGKITSD